MDKKEAFLSEMISFGNDFKIEYRNWHDKDSCKITYGGKEIGMAEETYGVTTNGYIAVGYGDDKTKDSGVNVWNNITNKWEKIRIRNMACIIGWIERE